MSEEKKRLGDILVEAKHLSQAQVDEILLLQKTTKERFGDLIIKKGYLTETQLIEVLEFQLGIPHVLLYRVEIDSSIVHLVAEGLARRFLAFAFRRTKNRLTVAMNDPLDFYALEELRISTGFSIDPVIASKSEIEMFIDRYYGLQESVDELLAAAPKEETLVDAVTASDSPIVRLVSQFISHAVTQRASDIHIDPRESSVLIRYRIDGILRTEQSLPRSMHPMIAARIKIMAGLNIAERRLPQDGRMQVELDVGSIDVRVSTMATLHGEKCVLRLLDARNAVLSLSLLGMSEQNAARFKDLISLPNGIVLLTGPTGSGKTSTLYAALQSLAGPDKNIVTIEDPVEYSLPEINQVQVQSGIGMTFARGLRAILRQDPDVIMVGEIRDRETAEVAVRAALTGHLVFSTLHTNDAVSSVTRLIDMGIEPFLVASSIVGLVSQRLVRKICETCKTEEPLNRSEATWLNERGYHPTHLLKGSGCGNCHMTGYRGRIALHEVVRLDDSLRELILKRQSDAVYRKQLSAIGNLTILQDGLDKVMQGMTTLAEVLRVCMRDELDGAQGREQ
ncbi:GspE/PulE family protein [Ferroacidibacillus organovorans]|uniref:Type II secretion system protein GspE n=1 Tax=Ferroacidibacillus organovorans TaxID=1765683 RepID=A0A162TEJ3_9BACL|nr:GspE/PulE family protein [Ferroacidibacillus organovorans]KYP80727.1 type II secretion system protein GspE [Ferroacidibacillus organovorans]OAG93947.1 type II secretion system protein GspE [Ferroacidibacillus organovorans]OPG16410.1 type II secretion system protein GspE [Ferroacidibacillus organovorans]